MSNLTDKQLRFCEEYLIDLNATQAAIRAGYSEDTAKSIGCENLTKPNIQESITRMKVERSQRTQITADRVLQELAVIGFSSVQNYILDDDGKLELEQAAEVDSIRAVSSIRRKKKKYGHGKDQTEEVETEIKLWPKVSALQQMGQHLGIFEKDNNQKNANKLANITVIREVEVIRENGTDDKV